MKRLTVIFFFLSATLYASDTTRFTVLSAGKIAGKQVTWSDGQGKIHYRYEFNDRGRGPKLQVDIRLEGGIIVSRKVSGVDYFKGAVDETFEIVDGTARWKNKIENDQRAVSGPIIYSPMEGYRVKLNGH